MYRWVIKDVLEYLKYDLTCIIYYTIIIIIFEYFTIINRVQLQIK